VDVAQVDKASFSWESSSDSNSAYMRDISFEAKPGTLTMVVGSVASGKSSLLSALIGVMERVQGTAAVGGRVAYVAQTAWIVNDSVQVRNSFQAAFRSLYLRAAWSQPGLSQPGLSLVHPHASYALPLQAVLLGSGVSDAYFPADLLAPSAAVMLPTQENILMGHAFEPSRYQVAADVSCLLPDLAMWPAGDATEIGDRGVTLSGGQKARVSIARSVYADADVYLLDDPLAAVDTHVGRALFERCIRGVLRNKTVILVSC
jgi:ABC-type transport system involved in cytochrome bd biosynthesis fused ATPase/permease subunit